MSMLKIAAVVLIIVAGLIGVYIIVKTPDLSTVSNTGASEIASNNQTKPSVEWLDKSQSFISEKLGDLNNFFSGAKDTIVEGADNPVNLTKKVAGLMFDKLKNSDQQGENPFQNLDLNNLSDAESQKLIQEMINSVQNPMFLSVGDVDNSKLKISLDNSQKTKTVYLENIKEITQQRFSDPKYQRTSEELFNTINSDCFVGEQDSLNREFSNLYQNLVNDYLNLTVPSDWLEIHKRIIIYFKKAGLVYRDLAECSQDPIRGYVAIWALPQLVTEGQNIQTDLSGLTKSL